jgi:hypothetical protein
MVTHTLPHLCTVFTSSANDQQRQSKGDSQMNMAAKKKMNNNFHWLDADITCPISQQTNYKNTRIGKILKANFTIKERENPQKSIT